MRCCAVQHFFLFLRSSERTSVQSQHKVLFFIKIAFLILHTGTPAHSTPRRARRANQQTGKPANQQTSSKPANIICTFTSYTCIITHSRLSNSKHSHISFIYIYIYIILCIKFIYYCTLLQCIRLQCLRIIPHPKYNNKSVEDDVFK